MYWASVGEVVMVNDDGPVLDSDHKYLPILMCDVGDKHIDHGWEKDEGHDLANLIQADP
jgi:hypothetical protein